MKSTQLLSLISVLVIGVAAAGHAAGQSSQASKPAQSSGSAANPKPVGNPEAEGLLLERRIQAQSLLISLASDATTFRDQKLRARTLARIADVIWESDGDRARNLFRKAWDAAELGDAESQLKLQEEIRELRAKAAGGGYGWTSPPDLRKEVLHLAVKHDPGLTEEFLGKLQGKGKQDEAGEIPINPFDRDLAAKNRLELAKELLTSGEKERAVEMGSPLLSGITLQAIEFLSSLREKNAALADERYASLLGLAANNPQADLNTVSFLSSYIFTPHRYFYMTGPNISTTTMGGKQEADVAPALRTAFFRIAGQVLTRPIQPDPANNVAYASQAIRNYLPLFDQFAPEFSAGLRAQLAALTEMIPPIQRRPRDVPASEETTSQQQGQNTAQSLLDRIDRAKTSTERDPLFMQLALARAGSGDLKAREYVEKIDDSELRQSVHLYVDASLAWSAIERRDPEVALEIARTGELTHLLRVWTMTGAARMLMTRSAKTNRERALQILDEASTEARRIDGSDPDRPRALVAVTNAMLAIDPPSAWNLMNDAVKAANSAPDFTGADGELSFQINNRGANSSHKHLISDFDLAGVFERLARADFDRATELARVFEREAPRAHAVMAVALPVLNGKK